MRVSRAELLFSIKAFCAAMLALYIAMSVGLPRPFWSMMTAYIVAAPFTGPTRSKGLYRGAGTLLGAIAVLFMLPPLINAPELLSLALALWIGGCLYFSLLDRTPRSYMLMLAGYTAGLIGFPAVTDPGSIFEIALTRVEEILLGITCATLVHSLVFPQSFAQVLLARLDHAVGDAQHWIRDALKLEGAARSSAERRKLAGDITELRLMSTHLPFDTSQLRWTANAVYGLQERLAAFVPLVSGIEERLTVLRRLRASAVQQRWRGLLARVSALTEIPKGVALDAEAAQLREEIKGLTPALNRSLGWSSLIELNLAARLQRLVNVCVDTRALRQHIDAGLHGQLPDMAQDLPGAPTSALHQDRGMALLSAFAAALATLACCAFWILSGWSSGAVAPMMAAVLCCFFSTQDDPVPFIKIFLHYTLYSMPVSALYLLVLLPAVHSFEMMVLIFAPLFLLLGVGIARPSTALRTLPFLFGVCTTFALMDTHTADMASFLNSYIAEIVGLVAAVVCTRIFRSVGADWTARRLLRAGWRELARLGRGERVNSLAAFSARMVDRVGLLTPRLALAGPQQDLQAVDTLRDLRVGLNMTHLQELRKQLGGSDAAIGVMMALLARHFALRPRHAPALDAQLLDALDSGLRAICAGVDEAPARAALAALTGLRCDLFPLADEYQAAMPPMAAARLA